MSCYAVYAIPFNSPTSPVSPSPYTCEVNKATYGGPYLQLVLVPDVPGWGRPARG